MKIAFFLKNELIQGIDWQNIMLGNPGVGGSEYMIVLTSYMLTISAKYDVVLIVQRKSNFPKELHIAYAENLHDAIGLCAQQHIKFLAFKEDPRWINGGDFDNLPQGVGLILWCHNFLSSRQLDFYDKIPSVKSVICVGREQVDLYRDHHLFSKMDYIYNGFPLSLGKKDEIIPAPQRENIVTYIGSIVPFKGFHILAKAWPMVLNRVPDAQLYVIGSGQVYDDNKKMGTYGIADQNYEKLFMKYLTDRNGKVLPCVHFMGRLGEEKKEIIRQTKVGVPNPSGDTETFGIGAIEFEEMLCRVVTRRCCGYLDTVYNKINLYRSRSAKVLADFIVRGLNNPESDDDSGLQDFLSQFDIRNTVIEWEKLFATIAEGLHRIHDLNHHIPNLDFRNKWFTVVYARLNKVLNYKLPCLTKLSENKIAAHIKYLRNNHF